MIKLLQSAGRRLRAALLSLAALASTASCVSAAPPICTKADFASAVDHSAAQLREYNTKAGPELQQRMRRFAEVSGIPGDQAEDAAFEAIQDQKLQALDEQSASLLLKIDSLGRVEDGKPIDCAKLDEINTASAVLLSVMRQKSEYMQSRLDAEIAKAPPQQPATEKPKEKIAEAPAPKPAESPSEKPAAKPVESKPVEKQPAPPAVAKPAEPAAADWTAESKRDDSYKPLPDVAVNIPPPGAQGPAAEDGYSIDEIRDATRGFFGAVSTNLASVIEYAFKTSGRPTAYVLGTEGGGAFLAGLRYGKGTLFLRHEQGTRPVYWHGPSLGTDFGASGSRTMFLIYRMRDPNAIYRSFTGIDGSAYFVGGVGVTLLKGGDVIMAPIRSGLGFRVGANLGYVTFTDSPTWNPF